MSAPIDPRQIEILDDVMVTVLRALTPEKRLAISFGCNRTARLCLAAGLRVRHPDWSDDQISAEVARSMTRGTT
jgi:hypothetical protein